MILCFPNLDTLQLAVTSGAIPPAVASAPADAGSDEHGHVWIRPSIKDALALTADLKRLGVRGLKSARTSLDRSLLCWPQLVPLRRDAAAPTPGPETTILFECADPAQVPELVIEMLRLGNHRQSFRWLTKGDGHRALLKVIAPPHYTLRRALETQLPASGLRAYAESSPRVWCEVGFRHPLANCIQPPPGKMILIRDSAEWLLLKDAPFRDIHEIVNFRIPDFPVEWNDAERADRVSVSLRLTRTGIAEPGEFWVLDESETDLLEQLIQTSDEQLIARLAFAVGERPGRRIIVLRVRPGRGPVPILALPGMGYRSYSKLPNLFVPCGARLSPPLRRDVLRDLLAADLAMVTWLEPQGDGRFVPHTLPETSFRPLGDYVDYIIERECELIDPWIQSARFEFEPFIVRDEPGQSAPIGPPPPTQVSDVGETPNQDPKSTDDLELDNFGTEDVIPVPAPAATNSTVPESRNQTAASTPDDDQFRQRLTALESKYVALAPPIGDGERQSRLLAEMARLHGDLGSFGEAALCWRNAIWLSAAPSVDWMLQWHRAEAGGKSDGFSREELDSLASGSSPGIEQLQRLTASLAIHPQRGDWLPNVESRLGAIQALLEKHEAQLSVRGVWLSWLAISRLSGGDVLALARARDRILERFNQHGLNVTKELPTFLRRPRQSVDAQASDSSARLRELRTFFRNWRERNPTALPSSAQTGAYVDLIFAFGFAKLKQPDESRDLLQRALPSLSDSDPIHHWCARAFAHRIQSALEGASIVEPLPAALMGELDRLERLPRYVIDRLRTHSRILEPLEKIDPYRHWTRLPEDDLGRSAAELFDLQDREILARRLREVWLRARSENTKPAVRTQVIATALELAPRLGVSFATELVPEIVTALNDDLRPGDQALLLEKCLQLAAHFDLTELAQTCLTRLEGLLETQSADKSLAPFHGAIVQSLYGLRKLGMREEASRLLSRLAITLDRPHDSGATSSGASLPRQIRPELLKLRLEFANGWFYFGKDELGRKALDEARDILLSGKLAPPELSSLACAYCTALGHAPAETAFERQKELLEELPPVPDTYSTNTHFSRSELELAGSLVLATTREEFATEKDVQRRLEEEEYLVRKRIHREMREALAKSGSDSTIRKKDRQS